MQESMSEFVSRQTCMSVLHVKCPVDESYRVTAESAVFKQMSALPLTSVLSSGVLQQRQTVAAGDRPLCQRERQQAASRQQV